MSGPEWEPGNDIEHALLDAARQDDRQSYFQLIAVADLFLPQIAGETPVRQRFLTVELFDRTFLPVFTSWQLLAAQLPGMVNGYTITNYAELARKWPDPAWQLAINPGSPLDAYLGIEDVAAAAVGDQDVPTLTELYVGAEESEQTERRLREREAAGDYPDDPAQALTAASRAGDAYGYVKCLLNTVVLVPTGRPVVAEAIVEDGFPWRPAAEGNVIEVFTTREAFDRVHPAGVPSVAVAMPFVVSMWPQGYGLSVNPGGADGVELAPEQVIWLLS